MTGDAVPAHGTRFRALDACRGLCAVLVLLYHLDARTHFYGWPPVRHGYLAVDFFFVLSGFVIAGAYRPTLCTLKGFGRYAIRRFGRLYPLHAAVLLAYVLIECWSLFQGQAAFADNYSTPSLLASITLLQGFGAYHETWNYPAWSVSVELWANLAFGLYVCWLGRRSAILSAGLMLLAAAYVAVPDRFGLPASAESAAAFLDVAQSVFEFLLGTFLYAAYGWLRRCNWRPNGAAEILALVLAAAVFFYGDRMPGLLTPFLFGLAVLAFAFERGPVSALLRLRPFAALGTISYSVYLTHSLYLMALESAVLWLGQAAGQPASVTINGDDVLTLGGPWAMDAAAALCVLAALTGSALTYRLIEEPARRRFNAWSEGRPPDAGRIARLADPEPAAAAETEAA